MEIDGLREPLNVGQLDKAATTSDTKIPTATIHRSSGRSHSPVALLVLLGFTRGVGVIFHLRGRIHALYACLLRGAVISVTAVREPQFDVSPRLSSAGRVRPIMVAALGVLLHADVGRDASSF